MSAVPRPAGAAPGAVGSAELAGLVIDADFLADPYPAYAALREAGPVHWSEAFFGGAWLLTRHADVDRVLRDDQHFSAQRTGGWVMNAGGDTAAQPGRSAEALAFQRLFARAMLFVDGADHRRLRAAMSAGFGGGALQRLSPFIDQWVRERLDAIDARLAATPEQGFEFMAELARPLPAQVIAACLGIDTGERPEFVGWSDDLAAFIGAANPGPQELRRAQQALEAMAGHFAEMAARPRHQRQEGLLGSLLAAQAAGQIQPGAEFLAQCAMLLFAGHETTRNLLGNGLHALLSHPPQWQRLCNEPALLPGAVRELLRYDSPVQYTGRRVAADLLLHGRLLRRGDLVVALIGSANRDPARHERPDKLDIARRGSASLSFGAGPHVCIGATLTSMEAQSLFGQMSERWPHLRLQGSQRHGQPNALYRGLTALPVEVAPAAAA